jgi:hypothetical protein
MRLIAWPEFQSRWLGIAIDPIAYNIQVFVDPLKSCNLMDYWHLVDPA